MLRLLPILGFSLILLAGGILALSVSAWSRADLQLEEIRNRSSAVERFKESDGEGRDLAGGDTAPLIVQAEALARYLNPPKSPDQPSAPAPTASSTPLVPPVRPAAPSAKFKLHGTSYYPNQPDRSMALIAELGAAAGSGRWVKEGAQLGHFVIHEIRRGAIVYRDGDDLREMAVERSASLPSLVRDLRPGSLKVSAAMDGESPILPAPSGPNGVETTGGD